MTASLEHLNEGLAAAAARARAGLVVVGDGRGGQGAGVIWSVDGVILTNAHVVQGRSARVLLPDGRKLEAALLARHAEHDLAVLRVDAEGLPAVTAGDSRSVRPGQIVLALGHPWGVFGAATAGVVIGAGAALPENPLPGREWLAVSLHYRPGHSGGPLVDVQGRVIGLNTIMTGPDVGLAVPVHVAGELLSALGAAPHAGAQLQETAAVV